MSELFRKVNIFYEDQFLRKVNVSCGGREIESPPFDIHFQIRFDDDMEPGDATIDIFNLSDDTINMMRRGENLSLSAGYGDDTGMVFLGHVDEVESFWDGVDRVLRLYVGDATDRWLETHVQKTFTAGMVPFDVLKALLDEFGLEAIFYGSFIQRDTDVYTRGRTFDTRLKNALREVADDLWARLYISQGTVYVVQKQFGEDIAFILGPDTGLVDRPEKIENEDGEKWRVVSLLNHRIHTGSIIKVEDLGVFEVVSGEHVCDDTAFDTVLDAVPMEDMEAVPDEAYFDWWWSRNE